MSPSGFSAPVSPAPSTERTQFTFPAPLNERVDSRPIRVQVPWEAVASVPEWGRHGHARSDAGWDGVQQGLTQHPVLGGGAVSLTEAVPPPKLTSTFRHEMKCLETRGSTVFGAYFLSFFFSFHNTWQ